MASLDDFAPQTSATLDDFQIEGPLVLASNKPSNINLAAYTAALSEDPESVESTYLRVADDLTQTGQSEMADEIAGRARTHTRSAERNALVGIMTDPELSDEEKEAAANAYLDDESSLYDIRNIVAAEALIAPSGDETAESSNARINFAESIEAVNAFHREAQARLKKELDSRDPGMVQLGLGFVELMIPYMEQTISANVLAKVKEEGDVQAFKQTLTQMGDAKEEWGEAIRKMPHDQRMQVVETIIDAVNTSPSIVAAGANEFARIDFLRSVLEEGYYTDLDKFIDNAISVVDLALPFAGPVGAFLGSTISRSRAAARLLRAEGKMLETPGLVRSVEHDAQAAEEAAGAAPPRSLREEDELSAAEDASETVIAERREAFEADPVRRAEGAAEKRAEARRAVQQDTDDLARMEDEAEKAAVARQTGGKAARMTDAQLRRAEDAAEAQARQRYVRSDVQPVTLSQTYRNTNPEKARILHEVAATDETGHAARAAYGTSRVEAVAHDVLPEIPDATGSVKNKVSLPDAQPRPSPADPRVMDVSDSSGAIHLTDAEKIATATRVINDFNHVSGLVSRTEMTVPAARDIGGKLNIKMTYGPKDHGWSSAPDAVEKVKTSLRAYGVKDEDLTVLSRNGDEYEPIDLQEAVEGGDYLVQVDFPHTLNAGDLKPGDWNDLDVLWNFLDRVPHFLGLRTGSIQRHILDAHSMLHKNITLGASVSVARAAQLEKTLISLTQDFSKKFNKLSKVSQGALEREIKRANKEGRNKTNTELRADGFGDEEISALHSWREVWDTMYWLENQDLVKTLRNRMFGILEDPSTGTRLFVKELSRQHAGSFKRAYDPQTGKMVNLESEDLKKLYESNGSVATLRSPMVVEEEAAEFVISRNQPGGAYIRRLRDDDQVLNYREGYYTVYYEDPKFIDKIIKDSKGNVLTRSAIATAKDTPTARRFQKRFQAEESELHVEYKVRDSKDRLRADSDDFWNLQVSSGRTAQRVRGERLEDATSPITDEASNHIMGPVDSLIQSARNVSSRVGMRDYLEAVKARAVNQYGHMFPTDDFGRAMFPSSSKDIKAASAFGKEAADARTTVEYINTLEHGYINAIDDGMKYILRAIADEAGNRGFGMTERFLNAFADVGGPTRAGKNAAFTLYLALNPQRQIIVQSHQLVQLVPLNPRYVADGSLAVDLGAMLEKRATGKFGKFSTKGTGRSEKQLEDMFQAFEKSGLSASIDKSNLVRNSLSEIADSTSAGGFRKTKGKRAIGLISQGVAASRKAGFDLGEEINLASSWLTHWDMARKAKGRTDFSASELDEITAKAINYTYNMNRAGEMPYNQNALGLIFQFIQVPHKALLQMTTNRNLSKGQKARLAGFNLMMYGGPPGTVLAAYTQPWLPEEGESREMVLQGLEGYMFNKLASLMYGDNVSIDFSTLAAVDQTGLLEFITGLWTTDMGKVLAESPAGSLVMGSNPRITNFARSVAEYFHFVPDPDQTPPAASEVAKEFLKLSSGFSNAFKAKYALEYGKKINSSGGVTDPNVSTPEAIAAGLGLGTLHEARRRWVGTELYEKRKEFDDDAKEVYRLVKQNLAREGITNEEFEFQKRILNSAQEIFKDSPRAQEIFLQQLRFDVQNEDMSLHDSVLRSFEWLDPEYSRNLVNTVPGMDEEQRQQYRDTIDFIQQYREE